MSFSLISCRSVTKARTQEQEVGVKTASHKNTAPASSFLGVAVILNTHIKGWLGGFNELMPGKFLAQCPTVVLSKRDSHYFIVTFNQVPHRAGEYLAKVLGWGPLHFLPWGFHEGPPLACLPPYPPPLPPHSSRSSFSDR